MNPNQNSLLNSRVLCLLTLFLTQLLTSRLSHALELTAVGGANYAAPTQRTNGIDLRLTGNATPTFGLLLAVNLFDSGFDFETGIVALTQQSERDNTIPLLTQKMKFVEIPFVIRYNLDESIGLGVGGYAAFAQGNIEHTVNGITTETTYESLLLKKTDAGLIANIRARFALSPPLFFILDARYQHGFVNLAQIPYDILNTRSIQVMAGLTYVFDLTSQPEPEQNRVRIVE